MSCCIEGWKSFLKVLSSQILTFNAGENIEKIHVSPPPVRTHTALMRASHLLLKKDRDWVINDIAKLSATNTKFADRIVVGDAERKAC